MNEYKNLILKDNILTSQRSRQTEEIAFFVEFLFDVSEYQKIYLMGRFSGKCMDQTAPGCWLYEWTPETPRFKCLII